MLEPSVEGSHHPPRLTPSKVATPRRLLPSEYWRAQCRATFQCDRVGTKLIEDMGVETLMWGSDYPHPDGVWPESARYIEDQFSDLPAEIVHKMTCENAGKFYGLMN
jgi:predicted TIM-barrel fold metal-dependent hydrolase